MVIAKSPEETAGYFVWFTPFASADVPTSSERTRAFLGNSFDRNFRPFRTRLRWSIPAMQFPLR